MKALIWILSFIIFTFLNQLLAEAIGFRIGAVLFYLGWYFSCKALCNAWDRHKSAKDAAKAKRTAFETIKEEIPASLARYNFRE